MPSWLPHILVPTLVALAFFRPLPRKWVMALAPMALVPDLDYVSHFLGGLRHRELSHNVWVPLILMLAAWRVWRRRSVPGGQLAGVAFPQALARPGLVVGLVLCAYYWASHVLLDVFAGGALLLWPLSDTNFYLFFEFYVDAETGDVLPPAAEGGVEPGPPDLSREYTWISFEHTAILAFLAAVGLGALGWRLWRRRGGPDPATR